MTIFLKKEVAQARYNICKTCDVFNTAIKLCKECGCVMPIKVKFAAADCPLGKWAVNTNEQDFYVSNETQSHQ